MIFFTSDQHFGHNNILKICNRPFQSLDEMTSSFIKNWNATVSSADTIYILGDFSFKGSTFTTAIANQLNGRKFLIKGNHDKFIKNKQVISGDISSPTFPSQHPAFLHTQDYAEIRIENQWFILSHYPITDWNGFHRDSIMLHGHQHNSPSYNLQNKMKDYKMFDVGVDANQFAPIPYSHLLSFFS